MNLVDFLVSKLDDLKGTDILALDVRGKSSITDHMILCTGTSSRHVISLAQKLIDESKQAGIDTFGEESKYTADWIAIDFGQAIVHIMQADSREMYQLEKLWGDRTY
ncbi:ribosome silencing factor [Histophilus somni]|uniref:Ribosomal silencing factor RsfS n=1 Tax=Histophilus somni (strain 129Pt) TaxID=205914 RepID=Q0I1H0_HISS1|nr:ribosome silencing factor [Histophilus somni]